MKEEATPPSRDTAAKSLNGVQNLNPRNPDGARSLNGIQNLKPQAVPAAPAQTQTESVQAPTAVTPTPQVPKKP